MIIGGPAALTFAVMLGKSGLRLAFNNLNVIPTSPVDITKDLEPRIPGVPEVIVVNNRNGDKMTMSEPVQKNQECWLADQRLLNPNCEIKSTDAIGTSLPPQPRVVSIISNQNTNRLIQPSKVKLNLEIKPKIIMPSLSKNVKNPGELSLPTYIYLMDDKFLRRAEVSSIIRELRGGSSSTALIGNTIFVVVLYGIWLLASGSEGFVQQPNPGWGLRNNLYEPPGLVRPADCETQLYAGSPQQSRNVKDFYQN